MGEGIRGEKRREENMMKDLLRAINQTEPKATEITRELKEEIKKDKENEGK